MIKSLTNCQKSGKMQTVARVQVFQEDGIMMIELFYMFINTDLGEKVKTVLNDLFPGLIKEPKRVPVRVPVPQPRERRYR